MATTAYQFLHMQKKLIRISFTDVWLKLCVVEVARSHPNHEAPATTNHEIFV